MRKNIISAFVSMVLVAISAVGMANLKERGCYLGGDFGSAKITENDLYAYTHILNDNTSGVSLGVNGGCLFNKNFGLEFDIIKLPDETIDFVFADSIRRLHAKNNYLFALAGLGILPLTKEASLYGKLGYGTIYRSVDSASGAIVTTDGTFYSGVGTKFAVSENLTVNLGLDYMFPAGSTDTNIWRLVTGISYYFN